MFLGYCRPVLSENVYNVDGSSLNLFMWGLSGGYHGGGAFRRLSAEPVAFQFPGDKDIGTLNASVLTRGQGDISAEKAAATQRKAGARAYVPGVSSVKKQKVPAAGRYITLDHIRQRCEQKFLERQARVSKKMQKAQEHFDTPNGKGKRQMTKQDKDRLRRDQIVDTLRKLKSKTFPQIFQGLRQATTLELSIQDAQESALRFPQACPSVSSL